MEAKLKAEREQFEMEKQEHYEIYDKQQQVKIYKIKFNICSTAVLIWYGYNLFKHA